MPHPPRRDELLYDELSHDELSRDELSRDELSHDEPGPDRPAPDEVVRILVRGYSRFLDFLERRVGSRDVAEDILQDAFVRGVERAGTVRSEESATAWFYRVLRRALADHYRRRAAEARAHDQAAAELGELTAPAPDDEELWREVCDCVGEFLPALKPEYATALRRVELEGTAVRAYAAEAQITANNASVRLHRAREALKREVARSCGSCAEHRCLDCDCRKPRR